MRNTLKITLFAAGSNLMSRIFKTVLAFLAALTLAAPARATILVDQSDPQILGYYVGGSLFDDFTAYLAGETGGYTIGHIANSADVAAASSVLVDLRGNPDDEGGDVLSATEQTNLSSALAAGKHVVLLGENMNFTTWTNSILGFAGGASIVGDSQLVETVTPVVNNALTAGISSIDLALAGVAGGGTGGTPLFTLNWATLWGPNLLTALDVNVLADPTDMGFAGNAQWEQNVANFLGPTSAVPLPAALPLFASGLIGLGWLSRRRRKQLQAA